jgi:hypothetical protein
VKLILVKDFGRAIIGFAIKERKSIIKDFIEFTNS